MRAEGSAVGGLRVAATVEQCWQPVPGGSGTYVVELTRALLDLGAVDLVGLTARHVAGDLRPVLDPRLPLSSSRLPRAALYEAWNRLRRPRVDAAAPEGVVHATTWALPGTRRPLVVTVHDLAFLREADHFTPHGNRYFRRAWEIVRAEAARIVVPSEATRGDCLSEGVEAGRIEVVPHGVRTEKVGRSAVSAWRARHRLSGPYVLWCGTVEPRKNVARLVQAFARARLDGHLADHTLVLAGPAGWGSAGGDLEQASSLLPDGAVRTVGRLSDTELRAAYSGADVFAYPSLWEGFGMPVLEAMAHGVPVVTSRGTSMAEVTGDLALLVDPLDVDDIAGGLVRAVASSAAERVSLQAHAGRFTWHECATTHAGIYRSVLRGA